MVFAVQMGDIAVIRSLLDLGADPNVCETSHKKRSPLQHAIYNEQLDIFRLLLRSVDMQ